MISPEAYLNQRKKGHLLRKLTPQESTGGVFEKQGKPWFNLSSNDYLDLANHPDLKARAKQAITQYGNGATSSRLIVGNLSLHETLEERLAAIKKTAAALIFGSGYLANVGLIPAVTNRDSLIIADKLAHACILDGAAISRAKLIRFQHNDLNHLETLLKKHADKRDKWIVTESIFSMDGDKAPLTEINQLAQRYQARILVDEAHATGVFGPAGAGCVTEHQLQQEITFSMGTFSKALGSYGGFVGCSASWKAYLINTARSFIFSTGLPPATIATSLGALDWCQQNPQAGKQLQQRATTFRNRLQQAGLDTMNSESHIVPVCIGDNQRALDIAQRLYAEGIIATAIRPPTVPQGTARIRFSLTLAHTPEILDYCTEKIIACIS